MNSGCKKSEKCNFWEVALIALKDKMNVCEFFFSKGKKIQKMLILYFEVRVQPVINPPIVIALFKSPRPIYGSSRRLIDPRISISSVRFAK